MRVAGIMSGTSLDGIDVAIVDIAEDTNRETIVPVAFHSTPYSAAMRAKILAVSNAQTHTAQISRLNFELAEQCAAALIATAERKKIQLHSIDLIGCHGQTVFHEPTSTLQLGEAAVLAERTGISVVSNFRARDMAAGGQGAPLVPFFDYRYFRHQTNRRVALNIGGIANVTVIPAGAELDQVTAFDTGPGNMVIDQLVELLSGNESTFDNGGGIAESATPNRELLAQLLADGYYRQKPPKTAGREQYGREFISRLMESGSSLPDLIATATLLTAETIAMAVGKEPGQVIASGGGVHNLFLMSQLRGRLPHMEFSTTLDYGIDPDAKEAIAFALLAHETWHHRVSNVPRATGAKRAVVLGDITRW